MQLLFPRCYLLFCICFQGFFYFAIKENYFALLSGLFSYSVCGNTAYGNQANFSPSETKKDIEDMENDHVIKCQVLNDCC